jgi:bifunctional non-homologous end joining protein LigD
VRLYSRPGNDLTYRFPLIVETLVRLRSRSCIIDGEAVACDDNGVALFNRVRYRHHDEDIFLYAFDLIELNGDNGKRRRDRLSPLLQARPRRHCLEDARTLPIVPAARPIGSK